MPNRFQRGPKGDLIPNGRPSHRTHFTDRMGTTAKGYGRLVIVHERLRAIGQRPDVIVFG
ncbi:MAG TPA: hypothetical protein VFT66_07530 [Roseiflexaceae bacterium]|nr:hypothetical protein [Roseiflexaceae bacterium]